MSQHLYFLGLDDPIMAGLACAAKRLGFTVSGSQPTAINDSIEQLQLATAGIHCYNSYHADHLPEEAVVIVSKNITKTNPELVEAQQRSLEIASTAQFIQQLTQEQERIVVLGDPLAAGLIASVLAGDQSSVDIICSQALAPSHQWAAAGAVHFQGAEQVVISSSLQSASCLDVAAEALYLRPHLLVLAYPSQAKLNLAQRKQLQHLLEDLKQSKMDATATRLVIPADNAVLAELVSRSGLSYSSYSLQNDSQVTAKPISKSKSGTKSATRPQITLTSHQLEPTQTSLLINTPTAKNVALLSSLTGQSGLIAVQAAVATAEIYQISSAELASQVGLFNGLANTCRLLANSSQNQSLWQTTNWSETATDLYWQLTHIQQKILQQSPEGRLWLIASQPWIHQLTASKEGKQALQLATIIITIANPMPSATDHQAIKADRWPASLRKVSRYSLSPVEMGQFVHQFARPNDGLVIASSYADQQSEVLAPLMQQTINRLSTAMRQK